MSGSRKILILGGLALAAFGMLYGLHYAVFVEHEKLDRMGASLTEGFVAVAGSNRAQASAALRDYGDVKYDYVRQVDAHSHWIGLAMLMIVLGMVFGRTSFAERTRQWLAIGLLTGSILFPLGVLLQTAESDRMFASGLAVVGAALVTAALAGVAIGFARSSA